MKNYQHEIKKRIEIMFDKGKVNNNWVNRILQF